MLTEQEREWLRNRKNPKDIGRRNYPCSNHFADVRLSDLIDALMFETRVDLWLLVHDFEDVPCANGLDIFCPRPKPPFVNYGCGKWRLLRCARLAVEQEMEGEQ